MKKLFVYMKGYGRQCVLGPLFKLLEASLELLVPLVIAAIIDRGIAGGDRGYILRMGLLLAALGLVGLIFSVTAQYFAADASVGFVARIKHALFAHLQSLSYAELDKLPTVRRLSPHCCRHTYVTNLQRKGVPMETIAALVGHSDIETTDYYLHISQHTLREAVVVLNQEVE